LENKTSAEECGITNKKMKIYRVFLLQRSQKCQLINEEAPKSMEKDKTRKKP